MSEQKLHSAKEITYGPIIPQPATSLENKTGGWRSFRPLVDRDKCTGCLFCWIFCPDSAIKREKMDKGFKVHVNYDYCKGCGICANVCPVKAITMEKEG